MGFDLSDYNTVPERIVEFREKHPEGSLQSEIVLPEWLGNGFVVVKAYAYRSPDDPRPGVGLAWEPVPGKTPYTRDSELMNAETSAWGRAIIAALAGDAKKIASQEEVKSRQVEHGAVRGSAAPVRQEEAGGEAQVGRTPSAKPPAPSTDELAAKPLILKLRRDLRSMAAKNKVELPDLKTLTHEQLQELETDLKKAVAQ